MSLHINLPQSHLIIWLSWNFKLFCACTVLQKLHCFVILSVPFDWSVDESVDIVKEIYF